MQYPVMHPFPAPEDLQFLIGLEVGQVCLDPWSTQFHFSEGGQITIEGQFEHVDAQGRSHIHQSGDEQDVGPVFLRALTQQRVEALEVEPFNLTLRFSSGETLRVKSDEGPHEYGQIYPPGRPDKPIVF
jgi:hypothetical protein